MDESLQVDHNGKYKIKSTKGQQYISIHEYHLECISAYANRYLCVMPRTAQIKDFAYQDGQIKCWAIVDPRKCEYDLVNYYFKLVKDFELVPVEEYDHLQWCCRVSNHHGTWHVFKDNYDPDNTTKE